MLNLPSFTLENYDEKNIIHHSTIIELSNELSVQQAFYNLEKYLDEILTNPDSLNRVYIAFENQNPLGFISLSKIGSCYQISYAILKEMRLQHKATTLLNEFTQIIFQTEPEIDKLVLFINKLNTGSKIVAQASGYTKENQTKYSITCK